MDEAVHVHVSRGFYKRVGDWSGAVQSGRRFESVLFGLLVKKFPNLRQPRLTDENDGLHIDVYISGRDWKLAEGSNELVDQLIKQADEENTA
jgi:hypothetical protein